MKKLVYSVGLLSIVLAFTLSSCTQDTINKLQGEWTMIPVYDVNDTMVETWEFTNDNRIIVRRDGTEITHGEYSVEAKFLETRLITTGMTDVNNYNFYDAEWWIVDLKRNTMMIVNDKDGGLYTREFERP
ncbi:MAG: hypothetical protein POELPBGB_03415 [Bacteroidia bacterium]|nr:hypothetical protein [Bacteroidia bacterium]